MNMSWSRSPAVPKKRRGKPVGTGTRHDPYFPEKVEIVRDMHLSGKPFSEIGDALGMTRAGAYYIWKRWIEPDLPRDQ